jgi:multidrug efflux pump
MSIRRPVATSLLAAAIVISGILALFRLPVAPLPNIVFPVVVVQAFMAGASPEIMASTVAEPLERRLGTMADLDELTSMNVMGASIIVNQFGLDHDVNGALRDVQAAIRAARADLPLTLRSTPAYYEYNPSSVPIMAIAVTSDTLTTAQVYDFVDSVLDQQLSQVRGVGKVILGGGSPPAVRVELEPGKLNSYGIGLEDVRAAIGSANANSAKGHINQGEQRFSVLSNDQLSKADVYRDLVIAYRNGAPVMLRDVAEVLDSNENIRNAGLYNGKPAVIMAVYSAPNSNIVETVQRLKDRLQSINPIIPPAIKLHLAMDRSQPVKASVYDTGETLVIAVLLVIGVVFVFLGSARAALIPAVALLTSIIGTFGPMYLLGYSIDMLSLMALTISTGFVVDDAVVVLENTVRHIEAGLTPKEAAFRGASEVSFTVISMSLSLVAVFLPTLLMPGIFGLFFLEFGVTLCTTILISLLVSLTITPAMCAFVLKRKQDMRAPARWSVWFDTQFERFKNAYSRSLEVALNHGVIVLIILFALLFGNVFLARLLPSTLAPEQDTGILMGQIIADQGISFQAMEKKLKQYQDIELQDPAVALVASFTGNTGGPLNTGFVFTQLKPLAERQVSAEQVLNRLRPKLNAVSGSRMFMQTQQDLHVGGVQTAAEYQYTLTSKNAEELSIWVPRLVQELEKYPGQLLDVNSNLQENGLEEHLTVSRATAKRYGFDINQINEVLYDAFGQRIVSTIYNPLSQYFVVMEVAPQYTQHPQSLDQIWLSTAAGNASGTAQTQMPGNTVSGVNAPMAISALSQEKSDTNMLNSNAQANQAINSITNSKGSNSSGSANSTAAETMVPLLAMATSAPRHAAIQVNHRSGMVAGTISFNLPEGGSLSEASAVIEKAQRDIKMPASVQGSYAGVAKIFSESQSIGPILLLAALVVVYMVLGILYEDLIHPITILSTLPSAGVGAVLALLIFGTPLSIIALIGIVLLIGIVKKNGIMMVDVAIHLQRHEGMDARRAIHDAAILRLRPIMMTTAAAVLGAVPLTFAFGQAASLRQPLGVTVMGGLVLSQIFTLYTTPVIYLYLDRLRARLARSAQRLFWSRRATGGNAS